MKSRADKAVWFINRLTLTEEFQGQPATLAPWQEQIIRGLYQTDGDGKLIIHKSLLLLPRKQTKTQIAGNFSVEHILNTKCGGRVVLVAAGDRYQAGLLFKKVKTIIEADPYLARQCRIYNGIKRIETKTGNVLQVMSGEGKRSHGENPSLVIADEVWTYPNMDLLDALTSGFSARSEYLTLMISTQGNSRQSPIYQEYEYAKKVMTGVIKDPTYFPVIYEGTGDWRSEDTWYQAMPTLKTFGNLDYIRSEFARALEIPTEESKFRQFYLNQLVANSAKWINAEKWKRCHGTVDTARWKGRPVYWGLDLSSVCDITALVGVCEIDSIIEVVCYFWIPEKYAQERDRKGMCYTAWKDQGLITFTPGDEIDYPILEEEIPKILNSVGKCKKVFVDPYNATSTTQRLQAAGLPVYKHPQGWKTMSSPIKYTEVAISKGKLRHDNPVLDWMADNTVVHRDRLDNLTFDKLKSSEKIDGVVAACMGIAALLSDIKKPSIYSSRPINELLGIEDDPIG